MNARRGNTLSEAEARYHEARGTSHAALERQEQGGHRAGNEQRVAKMWAWLAEQGLTPCSMATAAQIVTERFGEYYFTQAQTNADVVRKRTADLMNRAYPPLERVPDQEDPDGRRRDWFQMVAL